MYPDGPWASRLFFALLCAMLASCGDTDEIGETTSVVRTERIWTDASRPTPRTAAYGGAPQRTLRVLIWQPTSPGAFPLLVLAHGFGGLPEKFDAFARAVAAAGFLVAAPAFPLTNENAPGGHELGLRDFIHQPADLSFLITQLLNAARDAGDPLRERIQPNDVAVLGHSLGGVTVLGLTRKDCCRDERVRASILVAAVTPLADALGPDPLAAAGPPTLIIHGTEDDDVAYSTALQLYDRIDPPRFLVGLQGAGHSEALESQVAPPIPARDAAQRATTAFLAAQFRGAGADFSATLAQLAGSGNVVKAEPSL